MKKFFNVHKISHCFIRLLSGFLLLFFSLTFRGIQTSPFYKGRGFIPTNKLCIIYIITKGGIAVRIPKPLVQINQTFIVVTGLLGIFFHMWLLLPFLIGVYTLATKQNPIIVFCKRFLSKPLNQYPQEDKDQQIFNQWIATICLGLSLLFYYLHWDVAGYVFNIMVVLAAGIALMGFCIGCFIRYQYMMWKHRRASRT